MVTILCVGTREGSGIVEGIKDGILVRETSITVTVKKLQCDDDVYLL
jgi:hypothetical protein